MQDIIDPYQGKSLGTLWFLFVIESSSKEDSSKKNFENLPEFYCLNSSGTKPVWIKLEMDRIKRIVSCGPYHTVRSLIEKIKTAVLAACESSAG